MDCVNAMNWYVDPSNESGCARDQNVTCTTDVCSATDGPCQTFASIQDRWRMPAPGAIATVGWVSSESPNPPPIDIGMPWLGTFIVTLVAGITVMGFVRGFVLCGRRWFRCR